MNLKSAALAFIPMKVQVALVFAAVLILLQGCAATYGKVLGATDIYTPISRGMFGEDYGNDKGIVQRAKEQNEEHVRKMQQLQLQREKQQQP